MERFRLDVYLLHGASRVSKLHLINDLEYTRPPDLQRRTPVQTTSYDSGHISSKTVPSGISRFGL
jgi:hypothetical protein